MAAKSIYRPLTVPVEDDDEPPEFWGNSKAQVIEMKPYKKARFCTWRRVLILWVIAVLVTALIAIPTVCSINGCGRTDKRELIIDVDGNPANDVVGKTTGIQSKHHPHFQHQKSADKDSDAWRRVMDYIKKNEKEVEDTMKAGLEGKKDTEPDEINIDDDVSKPKPYTGKADSDDDAPKPKPYPYIGKAEINVKPTVTETDDSDLAGSGDYDDGFMIDGDPAVEKAHNRTWRKDEKQWKKAEEYEEPPRRYWDDQTQRWLAVEGKPDWNKDVQKKNKYDVNEKKKPVDDYRDEYEYDDDGDEDYSDEYDDDDYSDEYSDDLSDDYSDGDYYDYGERFYEKGKKKQRAKGGRDFHRGDYNKDTGLGYYGNKDAKDGWVEAKKTPIDGLKGGANLKGLQAKFEEKSKRKHETGMKRKKYYDEYSDDYSDDYSDEYSDGDADDSYYDDDEAMREYGERFSKKGTKKQRVYGGGDLSRGDYNKGSGYYGSKDGWLEAKTKKLIDYLKLAANLEGRHVKFAEKSKRQHRRGMTRNKPVSGDHGYY